METLLKDRIAQILHHGWRQSHLAEVIGRPQATVSKWVGGYVTSISLADARQISMLTGFHADWIVLGLGAKYLPGGPKDGPGKSRRGKNYPLASQASEQGETQTISMADSSKAEPENILLHKVQELRQLAQSSDHQLSTFLTAWLIAEPANRMALARSVSLLAAANLAQLPSIQCAILQAISPPIYAASEHLLSLALLPQEALLINLFRVATPEVRLGLLDIILETKQKCDLQDVQSLEHEPGMLSGLELRMLGVIRAASFARRTRIFDLVLAQAQELGMALYSQQNGFVDMAG